jgi:hypothetical protein
MAWSVTGILGMDLADMEKHMQKTNFLARTNTLASPINTNSWRR